ncbi:TRAF family member-associated NF-kappa-B activator isoform X2 [Antechinus flavipes]|uniref:TRAF family member-associated NF-kappa-B activator isoform X2 n=1 Tax=Antechinus flavipes TaxID=38775 RepID=UPI0022367141|nr:TRAF family member-associated NF-kappa-B activator isoform X2 [Antechinus flavipes]
MGDGLELGTSQKRRGLGRSPRGAWSLSTSQHSSPLLCVGKSQVIAPPGRRARTRTRAHTSAQVFVIDILFSDATRQRGMDKNMGEQLNKAYEAFRQACMDRDSAVKELQQKTEDYEQRIREQQEQLSLQQSIIDKLKSQLLLVNSSRDNVHGYVPMLEESEKRKNDIPLNVTFDHPHDKVKSGISREKHSKPFLHFLLSGFTIMSLISTYLTPVKRPESSPRQENPPGHPSFSLFNKRIIGLYSTHCTSREEIEKIFYEMKEEFRRICMLARVQRDYLNRLNIQEPIPEIQFSMPIQCTDKTDEQQPEEPFKPQVKDVINRGSSHITSVTPRGLGQEEENNSLESLSKFNVKFPPTDNDSTFLHSTPDKPQVMGLARTEAVGQDKFEKDLRDDSVTLVKPEGALFEPHRIDLITSAMQNITTSDKTKPSNSINTCTKTALDKAVCLPAGDHDIIYVNKFLQVQDNPGVLFASPDSPGRAVRGPQQPFWKPYPNQENDLFALSSTDSELHIPQVCEFCQAVFPPSITSTGDFLRHLNSHFNGES